MPTPPDTLRISQVLDILRPEFPELTSSKLRFLEDQGLISPYRSPSGYRRYSPEDVHQIRFILTQQRDHYLPLKVIRTKLDDPQSPHGTVSPVAATVPGSTPPPDEHIAHVTHRLAEYGIEPRHLRGLQLAADRHIALIEQIVTPWVKQGSPRAARHARHIAQDIATLCTELHQQWVTTAINNLTDGQNQEIRRTVEDVG